MWRCEKFGQVFEKKDQGHNCRPTENPIDAYIATQPEQIQPLLQQVRDILRAVLPDAQERISYGIPTFWKEHNIIHFAAHKNHLGLYPGDKAVAHFSDRLKEYKTSKGAVQFPYDREIPQKLIEEIAV